MSIQLSVWGGRYGIEYEQIEFQPDSDTNEWECPECKEVVATDEDKATAILKGESNAISIPEKK